MAARSRRLLLLGLAPALLAPLGTYPSIALAQEVATQAQTIESGRAGVSKPSLEEQKERLSAIGVGPMGDAMWTTAADVDAYKPATLSGESLSYVQGIINLMREMAGVGDISLTSVLNDSAAQGALLMARNNEIDHDQKTPSGLTDEEVEAGKYACAFSNLTYDYESGERSRPILGLAVYNQMADGDVDNMSVVGHRRWLLSPYTNTMGVGSARAKGGAYCTAIRVFGDNVSSTIRDDFDYIAWPASGDMLPDLFFVGTPWSVSLNPNRYQAPVKSSVSVVVTRESDGKSWTLNSADSTETTTGEYFNVDISQVALPNCIIFNPGSANIGTDEFSGRYHVEISGLRTLSGQSTSLAYTVNFGGESETPTEDEKSLKAAPVSGRYSYPYTPGGVRPEVRVYDGDKTLTEGVDYALSYKDNDRVGQASVRAEGMGAYAGYAFSFTFNITSLNLKDAGAISEIEPQEYRGSAVEPSVTVTYDGRRLTEGADYTLSYTNNSAPGTARVTATGIGNYIGTISREFEIKERRHLRDAIIEATNANFVYDGKAHGPRLRITLDGVVLSEFADYIVKNASNTEVGSYTAILEGKGRFEGDREELPYSITPASISDSSVQVVVADQTLTDSPVQPEPIVTFGGTTLTRGVDYVVSYGDNSAPGVGSVTVSGTGNFEGSRTATFNIVEADADTLDIAFATVSITVDSSDCVYDGTQKTPSVEVSYQGTTLTPGTDYTLTYLGNTDAGTAVVLVQGAGSYVGSTTVSFTIAPCPVRVVARDARKVQGDADPTLVADVTGTIGDTVSYDLWREAGEKPGTYGIIASGPERQGNYDVSFQNATLTIERSDPLTAVLDESGLTYSGTQLRPTVIVTSGDDVLTLNKDYKLTYGENVHAGRGTVYVTGLGTYEGDEVAVSFTISKRNASIRATNAQKTVGSTDPTLTYTTSNLAGSDSYRDAAVSRDAGETTGAYTIRVSGGRVVNAVGEDVTSDYNLSYVSGTFTIKSAQSTDDTSTDSGNTSSGDLYDVWPMRDYFLPNSGWNSNAWRGSYYGWYDDNPYRADRYSSRASTEEQTSDTTATVTVPEGSNVIHRNTGESVATTDEATTGTTKTLRVADDLAERLQKGTATSNTGQTIHRNSSDSTATTTSDATGTTTEGSQTVTASRAGTTKVQRLDGATRYQTMVQAVNAGFEKSDWVIIASGDSFPDALSAAALAGIHKAPIVLTSSNKLSTEAGVEILRLGAKHVVIMGGTSAVSPDVEASLRQLVPDVTRVSGIDRASTSVEALKAVLAQNEKSTTDTVIIASGNSFADALSVSPFAWRSGAPVILTQADGRLTADAAQALGSMEGLKRIIIVGGTSAVSDDIRTQLPDGLTYVRLGGADRYETSRKVAEFCIEEGMSWSHPVVATGTGFADALAGAALAGCLGSPLLLSNAKGSSVTSELADHATTIADVYVLGGTKAISQAAADAFADAIG